MSQERPSVGCLFQRKETGIWYYQVMRDGKILRKSLKTKDRAEAERLAAEIALPFQLKDQESFQRMVVDSYVGAKGRRMEAEEATKNDIRIGEAFDLYDESPARTVSATKELDRRHASWSKFTKWCWDNDLTLMAELTFDTIAGWATDMRDGGIAPRTYNGHVKNVRKVFDTACPDLDNPFRKIALLRETSVSYRDLSDAEIDQLLELARGDWKRVVTVGMYTGLRFKDAVLLEWASVDFTSNKMHVTPYKTSRFGSTLKIPMHQDVRQELERTPLPYRKGMVCPGLAARYRKSPSKVSAEFSSLLQECGIETQKAVAGRAKKVCVVGFPSLRHRFVTECLRAGVPRAWVEEIVGHDNAVINRVYSHLGEETAIAAIGALPGRTKVVEEIPKVSANRRLPGLIDNMDNATNQTWKAHWSLLRKYLLDNPLPANVQNNARIALHP